MSLVSILAPQLSRAPVSLVGGFPHHREHESEQLELELRAWSRRRRRAFGDPKTRDFTLICNVDWVERVRFCWCHRRRRRRCRSGGKKSASGPLVGSGQRVVIGSVPDNLLLLGDPSNEFELFRKCVLKFLVCAKKGACFDLVQRCMCVYVCKVKTSFLGQLWELRASGETHTTQHPSVAAAHS